MTSSDEYAGWQGEHFRFPGSSVFILLTLVFHPDLGSPFSCFEEGSRYVSIWLESFISGWQGQDAQFVWSLWCLLLGLSKGSNKLNVDKRHLVKCLRLQASRDRCQGFWPASLLVWRDLSRESANMPKEVNKLHHHDWNEMWPTKHSKKGGGSLWPHRVHRSFKGGRKDGGIKGSTVLSPKQNSQAITSFFSDSRCKLTHGKADLEFIGSFQWVRSLLSFSLIWLFNGSSQVLAKENIPFGVLRKATEIWFEGGGRGWERKGFEGGRHSHADKFSNKKHIFQYNELHCSWAV